MIYTNYTYFFKVDSLKIESKQKVKSSNLRKNSEFYSLTERYLLALMQANKVLAGIEHFKISTPEIYAENMKMNCSNYFLLKISKSVELYPCTLIEENNFSESAYFV